MCGGLSCAPYWGPDLVHNPGMCPDCELSQQLFGSQAGAQSTEPHQPGPFAHFPYNFLVLLSQFCELFVCGMFISILSGFTCPLTSFSCCIRGNIFFHCIPIFDSSTVTKQKRKCPEKEKEHE